MTISISGLRARDLVIQAKQARFHSISPESSKDNSEEGKSTIRIIEDGVQRDVEVVGNEADALLKAALEGKIASDVGFIGWRNPKTPKVEGEDSQPLK